MLHEEVTMHRVDVGTRWYLLGFHSQVLLVVLESWLVVEVASL